MRFYNLTKDVKTPMYETLYREIKEDILNGEIKYEEKLPSRRSLAAMYMISEITVKNAYDQLLLEGYISSKPKAGYFVNRILPAYKKPNDDIKEEDETIKGKDRFDMGVAEKKQYFADFTSDHISVDLFPFSTWAKLMRKTLLDSEGKFTVSTEHTGLYELRHAIAGMMLRINGVRVNADNIIIGAGTEYLYGQIIKLLGQEKMIGVEDPGHIKVSKIYQSSGVKCLFLAVDKEGLCIEHAMGNELSAIHISPSHHFPTGIVMSAVRRHEIIDFAVKNDCYIIEDDYDSEFRFAGRPLPKLLDLNHDKVIYMNTFSKTLASSIRIAYMILPDELMKEYRERLGYYSCTVSAFEQYTLARFISEGYFERHINRMKNHYRKNREQILQAISKSEISKYVTIEEENSGLHFVLGIAGIDNDETFVDTLKSYGIKLNPVRNYLHRNSNQYDHKFIINYSDISEERIRAAFDIIYKSLLEIISKSDKIEKK